VLVNTHHLADQVETYLKENDFGLSVHVRHEPVLLGTAGTVCANLAWVRGTGDFLVIYADNYAVLDLAKLVTFHRERRADATLVVCPTDIPREKGIVTLDREGRVLSFVEKPARSATNLMSGGVYVVSTGFMQRTADELGTKRFLDFGYDVFPPAVAGGKVYAYRLAPDEFVTDIGTPSDYARVLGGGVA
jgi:mannose-1-phosphate guanylyltransferase